VLADGVVLETFRTPPGRLEHLLRGGPAEPAPPLALAPMPFPPPGMDE
jgi:hypothetical protein